MRFEDFTFDPSDMNERADYQRSIARTNRRDRGRYRWPTCGRDGALSARELQMGYHCGRCTQQVEGGI